MSKDITQRFLFENLDVRGEIISLKHTYQEILSHHTYPPSVARLLGESLAACALLSSSLKFDGTLVLQARSSGPISLLMAECNSKKEIRGIARYEARDLAKAKSLDKLMPQAILALTLNPTKGQRYQGIVPFEGNSLATSLTNYFTNSEQLATYFWLCADNKQARGLLLQTLPTLKELDPEQKENTWQYLTTLANSLTSEEMFSLTNRSILEKLFHQEDIRLFEEQAIHFHCSCSRQRSANALLSLGEEDTKQLLKEQQGKITIDCQFCNKQYIFDAADILQLFKDGSSSPPSTTKH